MLFGKTRLLVTLLVVPLGLMSILDTACRFQQQNRPHDDTVLWVDAHYACWIFRGDAIPEVDHGWGKGSGLQFLDFRDTQGQRQRVWLSGPLVPQRVLLERFQNDQELRQRVRAVDVARCEYVRPSWEGGQDNTP